MNDKYGPGGWKDVLTSSLDHSHEKNYLLVQEPGRVKHFDQQVIEFEKKHKGTEQLGKSYWRLVFKTATYKILLGQKNRVWFSFNGYVSEPLEVKFENDKDLGIMIQ